MNCAIAVILALAAVAQAKPDWDGLRATWSLNPFSSYAFASLPRDLSGKLGDFKPRDNQCNITGAKFLGQRYWAKNDPAITLLFDAKGIIAGIQTSVNKTGYTPSKYLVNKYYIDDGAYWTQTAYFVDPSTICTGGRTTQQLQQNGTGSNLYFQNGPDPVKDSVKLPTSEADVKKTAWKYGHCFYTMGNHYWYNVTKDMDCDTYVPACLMYNSGKLTAFCFTINDGSLTSPRYEHPTAENAKTFIDPVPDCFFTDPSFKKSSSIHIYLIDSPRTSSWC